MYSKIHALPVSFALCLLSACAASEPPTTDAPAESNPDLTLTVFDCGRIRFEDVAAFGLTNEETEVRELAAPCYVIRHRDGVLLWDGGLPSALAETPMENEEMRMRAWLDEPLAPQLEAIGLTLADFDYVAFSHLHFDHVGVANEIQGATWLVQQAEFEAAFADQVTVPGFDPEVYAGLAGLAKITLDGDHDVFGDGSVRIISAPGHTPGHQVLFLDLEETGPLVLSGDLYHFRFNREHRRVPEFNVDAEATLASMDKVEKLVADTGASLWIEHDLALFETLNLAPAVYR